MGSIVNLSFHYCNKSNVKKRNKRPLKHSPWIMLIEFEFPDWNLSFFKIISHRGEKKNFLKGVR